MRQFACCNRYAFGVSETNARKCDHLSQWTCATLNTIQSKCTLSDDSVNYSLFGFDYAQSILGQMEGSEIKNESIGPIHNLKEHT